MNPQALCHADRSQLLLIDIQQRLASVMHKDVLAQLVHNANILLQAAQQLTIPVHHTEQYPKGLGSTLADLKLHLPEPAIEKTCFSSCGATGMDELISDEAREQWILLGMEAHICVTQTCMDLLSQDKTVIIVADGVCSRRKTNFKNALQRMRQAGAIIASTEAVLFEWLGDASHAQFKSLSRLVR